MNPRILGGAVLALALLTTAAWFFAPRSTEPARAADTPGPTAPDAVAVPAIPAVPRGSDAPDAADPLGAPDPASIPVVVLADQPGEIGDPMGNRPINELGLDAAVTEMDIDLAECHAALAAATPGLGATLQLEYEFNVEVPPPAYGAPEGPVAMMKAVRVAGPDAERVPAGPARAAFEACVLQSLDDILYDPSPAGARVRAVHEVTFGAQ